MEPLILLVQGWWWAAPAAAGVGAASYMGLTTGRRRARRLELDAARHEESQAYRALVAARAQVRVAQADVLAARSRTTGMVPLEAKRALQTARNAEKSASYALRASRARVKASYSQYRASSTAEPLPIERLYAAQDAVNARWLSYETDVDKALAFPQLTDSRHPATVAFLHAQREAQWLRPTAGRRIAPEEYVRYRDAVAAMDAALAEAERQAGVPGTTPAPQGGVAGVLGSVADMIDAAIPVIEGLRSAVVLPRRFSAKPPDSAPR
ncbi:hypothetical protein MK786_07780 [Microbacterium sp. CFH 31415]|uniref:hypothetical protein n=1 Tax=Microbacterium sp. CFH 31415 TaxID=2921732 RepID=UPI001F1375CE|nr:hypothetical protein [Microbacterium sp. CFH 31415]MCH6230636.1 hypothetical protein [Microbacterium sp. CFH 31415]